MGNSYGRTIIENVGKSIQVTADGRPEMKAGGVTLDWTTITAAAADITLDDGVEVDSGQKYVRYGQVLCVIGTAEVQTLTFTGGPTAGAATITLPASGDESAQTAAAVAYNATAAEVAAALNALTRLAANGVSVARAGAGSAGDPYVYTITFNRRLGNQPQLTSTHTFTGGTTPTTTHATSTAGAGTGLYGPYDTAATDGRQTLSNGEVFIVNETVKEDYLHSNHPPVLFGGMVFKDRVLATSTAAGSLTVGPTWTNLLAAMPRLVPVADA